MMLCEKTFRTLIDYRFKFDDLQHICGIYVDILIPGRQEGGGGGGLPRAPSLIGPQLESKSLKFSRFFKLVGAFLKLRDPSLQ